MSTRVYDAVIIGAGSAGLPTAFFLARAGLSPLVVDQAASPGQGCNKAAIGGVRATHSTPAKISLCLRSIQILSSWAEVYGDDIEWYQGGYAFVAYREREERILKELLEIQQAYGLDIRWLDRDEFLELAPGVQPQDLVGGTYSPGDGSASPLLSAQAFYRRALERGAEFRFGERVTGIMRRRQQVIGVRTDRGGYATKVVINAAGASARAVARLTGLDVPVVPDSHEAGITEPLARFLEPMVVDIRPAVGSRNCYFYQHRPGPVAFCLTPDPPIVGTDRRETSIFLPMIARRLVGLMPKLANAKIRRTWRGLYPMTPDGSPIVGWAGELRGFLYAAGMCGQGYMLGPGVGEMLARVVQGDETAADRMALDELSPHRDFGIQEQLA